MRFASAPVSAQCTLRAVGDAAAARSVRAAPGASRSVSSLALRAWSRMASASGSDANASARRPWSKPLMRPSAAPSARVVERLAHAKRKGAAQRLDRRPAPRRSLSARCWTRMRADPRRCEPAADVQQAAEIAADQPFGAGGRDVARSCARACGSEMSACLIEKSPPKPQHSSCAATATLAARPRSRRAPRAARWLTPRPRSKWHDG